MKSEEQELLEIERYIEGKLSAEEHDDFRSRMIRDPDFASRVDEYRYIIEGIAECGLVELESEVKYWEEELKEEEVIKEEIEETAKENKSTFLSSWLPWAAVFLLLMLTFAYRFFFYQEANYNALFTEHFEPYKNVLASRAANDASTVLLEKGMMAYEENNFEEAIHYLNQYLEVEPENSAAHFYLGVSVLTIEPGEQAAQHFKKVMQLPENTFKPLAEWHMALAYLKEEKKEELIGILEKISSEKEHPFKPQADQLLKELD